MEKVAFKLIHLQSTEKSVSSKSRVDFGLIPAMFGSRQGPLDLQASATELGSFVALSISLVYFVTEGHLTVALAVLY
jgi:hypothetical protein